MNGNQYNFEVVDHNLMQMDEITSICSPDQYKINHSLTIITNSHILQPVFFFLIPMLDLWIINQLNKVSQLSVELAFRHRMEEDSKYLTPLCSIYVGETLTGIQEFAMLQWLPVSSCITVNVPSVIDHESAEIFPWRCWCATVVKEKQSSHDLHYVMLGILSRTFP